METVGLIKRFVPSLTVARARVAQGRRSNLRLRDDDPDWIRVATISDFPVLPGLSRCVPRKA